MHAALSAIMAWLALALALPGQTFDFAGFSYFAKLGTEHQWSVLFLLAALAGLAGLVAPWSWAGRVSVFLLATAHGSVALCFYKSGPPDGPALTGTGTYAIIAAMGYFLCAQRFLR